MVFVTDTLVQRVNERIEDCQKDDARVFGYEDRHYPSLLFCCIEGYADCHCSYAQTRIGQSEPICTYRLRKVEDKKEEAK